MRQPYPLPETMIGNSAEAYFDFLMGVGVPRPAQLRPKPEIISVLQSRDDSRNLFGLPSS